MNVRLHPEADSEFAAQIDYYESKEPGLGHRFYDEVIATLDWISKNPALPRLRKGYRRVNLKVFRFYIAYVIESECVWVLAIGHGNKKPEFWKHRQSG